jgi:demethylmenaquinone methyltransferase/2-methoxy-6-polyprenyl-1,4-benzoquinol methylase
MLAAARLKAPAATLVQGEITQLPFEHETFDLTLAVTVLRFVTDPQRAVSELMRVTCPGGEVDCP